jgi:DNA-binding beta-propeller fold protein YncE
VGSIGSDTSRVDIEAEDIDLTDQSTTPNTPGSGQVRFYAKNGEPFFLTANGSENAVSGGVEEVSTFDNLPAIDPPQLAFVTDESEYYHSEPQSGTAFDIGTASFSKSIDTQDTRCNGIAFNDDGSKLYEMHDQFGNSGKALYELNLTTPFDIGTAVLSQSITPASGRPNDIAFDNTGSRLYETDTDNGNIVQQDLSTPFDISTASLSSTINAQDSGGSVRGITFNDDGSKIYEAGSLDDTIFQSALSTPFEISTASFEKSIPSTDSSPEGIAFNNDGTLLFEAGSGADKIYQSSLSTPFDIASASLSKSINSQDSNPRDVTFNNDGSSLYEPGRGSPEIYQSQIFTGGWIAF